MGTRIVIADDAPFMRELLRHMLESAGHKVVAAAADGNELVEMVARFKPDVAIVDLSMPNKSGLEAAQDIQELDVGVKMIACSTIDQQEVVMKALDSGCCGYIFKPFEAEDLLQAVNRAVHAQSAPADKESLQLPLKVGGQ